MAYGTGAEFGQLKKVLMHRPGPELDLVTEKTFDEYSFTAVPDKSLFREHFDRLTNAISDRGADVVLLTDVLSGHKEALAYIARRPNVIYTRDLAVMVRGGAILMGMALKCRLGDTWVIKAALERLGVPIVGEIAEPGILEGGGVTFIDERTCVAALCDRSNHWGVRQFCDIMLGGGYADEVVLVPMPKGMFHIDGEFMAVAPKTALIHLPSLSMHPARVLTKGGEVRYVMFPDFLAERGFTLIEITDEELGNGAVNIVVSEPFRGTGYDTGERLYGELGKYGGDYTGVPSEQLFKGKAGPHCMTCPLERS